MLFIALVLVELVVMFLGVLLVGEEQPQGVAVDETPAFRSVGMF